ncbi:hypothetical protein RclHR1_05440001 [Rhizophagus clarus]|uniref:Kinase-like domain-containing protein n=1 Tax=Rhizophagus clarus TaxID=94130 RepID=A0A2Z6RT06_9GLOM|nr:hypothetical protein RclHR1_05440001 [Rhizophagus clarus]GES79952.1 kinase-like domain-containing protein [Rhizophagus clarus]
MLHLLVCCYGITKDPETNNFMMVMELKDCSLRQFLNVNFNSLNWRNKLFMLYGISYAIKKVIHNSGFIHHDIHCGNLLSNDAVAFVTDLGLCQPANVKSPYHDMAHDGFLVIKICNGLRPKSNYKIPQLILDIINQCLDANPSKRPKAAKLRDLFNGLYKDC